MKEENEMTARMDSVGAESGQSSQTYTDKSITGTELEINDEFRRMDELLRRMQRMADPSHLHTVSMTELYQTTYQSRPPVIDGLLYTGAYILAGAPKIGKSFLVAQIAYHVSTGEKLWGMEVRQGTALYLALEDQLDRIQRRMFQMYDVNDSPNLRFATAAGKAGSGLDEQLDNFIREYPDTRLIIIDTLQKIREIGGEAYSYASDYEIVGRLKQLADKHGVCILTVHHTRKQQAGDTFEMISGTTGLLGCADGSLVMQKKKRTALEATVDVVGRDQQDQILYLTKDPDTQLWELERTETELHKEPPDPILEAVAAKIKELWCGSPTELAGLLNLDLQPNALTKRLNITAGRLLTEYGIRYESSRTHTGRKITLTPEA
jgi:RecA-family ATPase